MLYRSTGLGVFLVSACLTVLVLLVSGTRIGLGSPTTVAKNKHSTGLIVLALLVTVSLGLLGWWLNLLLHPEQIVLGVLLGFLVTHWFTMLQRDRALAKAPAPDTKVQTQAPEVQTQDHKGDGAMIAGAAVEGQDAVGTFRVLSFAVIFVFTVGFIPALSRPLVYPSLRCRCGRLGSNLKLSLQQPVTNRNAESVFGPQGSSIDRAAALRGPVTALSLVIDLAPAPDVNRTGQVLHTRSLCDLPAGDPSAVYRSASVIQRDMLIAAYLGSSGNDEFERKTVRRTRAGETPGSACGAGSWASPLHPPFELFAATSGALSCARHYAETIRDFRLLLLDIHEVLRAFLALSGNEDNSVAMSAR